MNLFCRYNVAANWELLGIWFLLVRVSTRRGGNQAVVSPKCRTFKHAHLLIVLPNRFR